MTNESQEQVAIPWVTPLCDSKGLYFEQLIDMGRKAKFVVQSDPLGVFEITLGKGCGPYVILDEEDLVEKNGAIENQGEPRWTYEILNSKFALECQGFRDALFGTSSSELTIPASKSWPTSHLQSRGVYPLMNRSSMIKEPPNNPLQRTIDCRLRLAAPSLSLPSTAPELRC